MDKFTLNPEQEKAASHFEGPMLVIAGAGSGKTRVVTARIVHLIEMGILPSDILALTFTNKAASEMKERVQSQTKQHVLTTTFHSLGARILRESIHHLGYSNTFTIYDTEDSQKVLKSCFQTLDIKEDKALFNTISHEISKAKNDLVFIDQPLASSSYEEKLFAKLYPLYQSKLKEYNAVDFDDLLFLPICLFHAFPEVEKEYQQRWLFVLIDEYQDTNHAQYILAKTLVAKHQNIFAVGDPDQSIYSWRGAQYQNILRFDQDFRGAEVIHLEHNYRSTNHILSAANAVISQNSSRYEKNLWSSLGEGEKVKVHLAQNEKFEAQFVIQTLLSLYTDKKIPYHEMVIFYRTNSQSRIFEDLLLEKKIPYIIYGGLSFYQRKEIKDIFSFLKLIDTDSDYLSFSRTLNLQKRGIGQTTQSKLLSLAESTKTPIIQLCKMLTSSSTNLPNLLSQKQKNSMISFLALIDSLRKEKSKNLPIHELIEKVLEKTDYQQILKEDPETYEERFENVQELITKAAEWHETKEGNLTQFLEELTLLTSAEEKVSSHSCLHLMTVHNGKGLEFEAVFIVGLEEDLFPHINSKNFPEDLEEERRLFYVGMTRAKKYLYLVSSRFRHVYGSAKFMLPSRFFQEIPAKHLEYLTPLKSEMDTSEEEEEEEEKFRFSIGDRIVHKVFGIGTITNHYNTSLGATYDVQFDGEDVSRSLVAKYAKLEMFNPY